MKSFEHYKKVAKLYAGYLKFVLFEHLAKSKLFRRMIGGTWYYVYDINDNVEYWTNTDVRPWHNIHIFIDKVETYE